MVSSVRRTGIRGISSSEGTSRHSTDDEHKEGFGPSPLVGRKACLPVCLAAPAESSESHWAKVRGNISPSEPSHLFAALSQRSPHVPPPKTTSRCHYRF